MTQDTFTTVCDVQRPGEPDAEVTVLGFVSGKHRRIAFVATDGAPVRVRREPARYECEVHGKEADCEHVQLARQGWSHVLQVEKGEAENGQRWVQTSKGWRLTRSRYSRGTTGRKIQN